MAKKIRSVPKRGIRRDVKLLMDLEQEVLAIRDRPAFDRDAENYGRNVKKYINTSFRKEVLHIRGSSTEFNPIYDFYYETPLVKRREAATLRCIPEAVRRFQTRYPELCVEHEFVSVSKSPCSHNYDRLENAAYVSVGAALFILDELRECAALPEIMDLLPDEEQLDEVWLPDDFRDCLYDDELVSAVVWLIQERNRDRQGFDPCHVFLDAAAAREEDAQDAQRGPAHQALEQIISKMRPGVVRRAVERFTEKFWEQFDVILRGVRYYREQQLPVCDRLLQLIGKMRRMREEPPAAPAAPLRKELAEPEIVLPDFAAMRMQPDYIDRIWSMAEQVAALNESCHSLERKQELIRMLAPGFVDYAYKYRYHESHLDPEVIDLLNGFSVENPYEICFAFLWLLDSGSDLPWLVNLGSGVLAAAAGMLPWSKPWIAEDDEEEVIRPEGEKDPAGTDAANSPEERGGAPDPEAATGGAEATGGTDATGVTDGAGDADATGRSAADRAAHCDEARTAPGVAERGAEAPETPEALEALQTPEAREAWEAPEAQGAQKAPTRETAVQEMQTPEARKAEPGAFCGGGERAAPGSGSLDLLPPAHFRRRYTDACMWDDPAHVPEDKLTKWNLPQLVYAYSGLVMPRTSSAFEGIASELEFSGVEPDLAQFLEAYLELADCSKLSLPNRQRHFEEREDAPAEPAEDAGEGEDAAALRGQILELKAELGRLKSALYDAEHAAGDARKKLDAAQADHEADRQELASLRELIYRLRAEDEDTPGREDSRIALPYRAEHRMVVFGGHETWLKAIQPMLPGVRFISSDILPNSSLIRHAEIVWLQTNAISHKFFYKIVDVTRTHKIPLRYFGFASAEKCARQLAEEDMKLR